MNFEKRFLLITLSIKKKNTPIKLIQLFPSKNIKCLEINCVFDVKKFCLDFILHYKFLTNDVIIFEDFLFVVMKCVLKKKI